MCGGVHGTMSTTRRVCVGGVGNRRMKKVWRSRIWRMVAGGSGGAAFDDGDILG